MSKSYPVQSYFSGQLEEDFKTFRDREKLGDAEALRQLATLALRIKLNDKEDDRPSNRELMEETYRRIRQVQGVLNINFAHAFDELNYVKKIKSESIEQRRANTALVDKSVDEFLSGEKG
ncbi:hypothetical protein QW180_31550 [Vibrio sinaloensis]|nr:hypothetical protein [Vibrio sinaloensis]